VRLLAFPGIERFPASKLDDGTVERARGYIAATQFKEQSILNAPGQVARVLGDRSGSLRVDWKMSSHEELENSRFSERTVPPGAKACVVGLYSEKENAIVPEADTGGVRLIRGSREEALEFLRDKRSGTLIAAVLFLLVPAPVTYAILMHREQYAEAHHEPSVRGDRLEAFGTAVKAGNVAAVREGLRHGVGVNAPDANGQFPLANAADGPTAAALIEAGADVNAPDRHGVTPIMAAAGAGHADVVRILIAHGANVNEKSRDDRKTALDYAAYSDQEEVIKVLREAGARPTP